MKTRLATIVTATALIASGSLFAASPVLASPTPSLSSPSCVKALNTLGREQSKRLASSKTLAAAALNCSVLPTSTPAASYGSVTLKKNTVGGVFLFTSPTRAILLNNYDSTALIMNGRTLNKLGQHAKYAVDRAPGAVRIAGVAYPAAVSASIGDGGMSITVEFPTPLPGMVAGSAATVVTGDKVTVYTQAGPRNTTVGPTYKKQWQTLNKMVAGTVVTAGTGAAVGAAGSFGTGYSSDAEYNFWKNRAYLMPASELA